MSTANADCFKEIFITPPLSGVFYSLEAFALVDCSQFAQGNCPDQTKRLKRCS